MTCDNSFIAVVMKIASKVIALADQITHVFVIWGGLVLTVRLTVDVTIIVHVLMPSTSVTYVITGQ